MVIGLLPRTLDAQRSERGALRRQSSCREGWLGHASVLGGLWLAVAALALCGCGQSQSNGEPVARRAPASPAGIAPVGDAGVSLDAPPPSQSPASPPAPTPPPPRAAVAAAAPAVAAETKAPTPAQATDASALPEKLADWKREHYYRARKEHDARLIEAVMYLGEHFAGSEAAESAALLLTNLLKPEEPKPGEPKPEEKEKAGPGGLAVKAVPPSTAAASDIPLLKAMIYALGATKSAAGRQELQAILAGTAGLTEDGVATAAALESLGFYACPENEAILLTVLSHPETIRKPEGAPATAATPSAPPSPLEKSEKQQRPPGFGLSGTSPAPGAPAPAAPLAPKPKQLFLNATEDGELLIPPEGLPAGTIIPGSAVPGSAAPGSVAAGGGKITVHEMQVLAWAWLQKTTSPQTRVALAKLFAEGALPNDLRAECQQFLLAAVPENLEAQLLLFRSMRTPGDIKAQLDSALTRFSSESLRALMGIPSGVTMPALPVHSAAAAMPSFPVHGGAAGASRQMFVNPTDDNDEPRMSPFGRGSGAAPMNRLGGPGPAAQTPLGASAAEVQAPMDAATAARLAAVLWDRDQVSAANQRLAQAATLATAVPAIVAASTMPVDATRAELYQLLKHHAEEGPASLEASGLFQDLVFEPGFVTVIKSMPRKDHAQPSAVPRRSKPNPNGAAPQDSSKEGMSQEWMRISEATVRALCARLKAAGRNRSAEDFPLELPPNARVTACFRWEWPTEEVQGWTNVALDPIKVYYACMEVHGRPNVALGFFKRRTTNLVVHELDKDFWAETFRMVQNSNRRQSLDVLITGPATKSEPVRGTTQPPEVDLTVELLSIEVKDPAPTEPPSESKGETSR